MGILCFDKPKKLRAFKDHADYYSSDTNIAGTYVPNMSDGDRLKWKARHIAGADPRVEIRKTVCGMDAGRTWASSAQALIIVRKDTVTLSANSRMVFGKKEWEELFDAVEEANALLTKTGVA